MSAGDSDFNDFTSDEEDNKSVLLQPKKVNRDLEQDTELDRGAAVVEEETLALADEKLKLLKRRLSKIRQVSSTKGTKHKTGVIYLSRIPPYMKPAKMRQILSKFGEIDRLFLKRESEQKLKSRIKSGGNKKTMYEEGWAEFVRKRDAKLCAVTLNGNIIGGKKGTFYHDDILNVKYLPGFKWSDLTEQIAKENDIRQSKIDLDMAQANKMNSEFVRNVEKSKMIENIKTSKKRRGIHDDSDNQDYDTKIKQHRVATNRADASESIKLKHTGNITNVLSNLL